MCDVGFNCLIYHLGPNMPALKGLAGLPLRQLGIPVIEHLKNGSYLADPNCFQTENEYAAMYMNAAGTNV